jgi:hypothetical protein
MGRHPGRAAERTRDVKRGSKTLKVVEPESAYKVLA